MNTRSLALLAAIACPFILTVSAQPKAELRPPEKVDPVEAEKKGQQLVADLLAQKPESGSSTTAKLVVRDPQGKTTETPVRFSVQVTATNIISRYSVTGTNGVQGETIVIYQRAGQPNEYFLESPTNSGPVRIEHRNTMRPFAGSDFWIADLGLDFLHWPSQQVIDHEMRKGQSCEVLVSRLPNAPSGAYSRVVSWIAAEKPGVMLVHADAYDAQGKILKQFDPRKLQRVEGRYQLKEMEIRNRQTGSRTVISFDLES